MTSSIRIFHKHHIKKWFPEIMETTFFTFNNFLLSRSLSVQASPTHRLLLFAIEAGYLLDLVKKEHFCMV